MVRNVCSRMPVTPWRLSRSELHEMAAHISIGNACDDALSGAASVQLMRCGESPAPGVARRSELCFRITMHFGLSTEGTVRVER